MPQHLDQPAAPAAEHEQVPVVRIALEHLLHQHGQPVEALAHVRMAGRQPHTPAARDRDHRRDALFASVLITADTTPASTVPLMRSRVPPANSISTNPAAAAGRLGLPASPAAAAIVTAANPGAPAVRSQ